MIWRILLLVMLILMVGLPAPANAEVLCAKPSGSVFVRSQCKNNEIQVGPVSLVSGGGTGWELVTSEVTIGADEFGVLSCPPREICGQRRCHRLHRCSRLRRTRTTISSSAWANTERDRMDDSRLAG